MGNCVPVHNKIQDPASKLKCSSYSRTVCIPIERPIRENSVGTAVPHVTNFQQPNGKEGMHFSPEPWLESDCEDFFSVNGDLNPSSTNTPIHQSIPPKETDVKKQLIQLFRESFNDESGDSLAGHQDLHYGSAAESSICDMPQSSAKVKSPYESIADLIFRNGAISKSNSNSRTRRGTEFAQCCLPNLVRSQSFCERKKR